MKRQETLAAITTKLPELSDEKLEALFSHPDEERRLIEGGYVFGADFALWQEMRRFLADALHRPGTLLDIGCANGLLLRCLMAWSGFSLVPYGVDVDDGRLDECRRLLAGFETHFAKLSLGDLERLPEHGLPARFDFVYWNVWDDIDFTEARHWAYLRQAFAATSSGGRLILGFYDADAVVIETKTARLAEFFASSSGRKDNLPRGEVMLWWDKGPNLSAFQRVHKRHNGKHPDEPL